MNERDPYLSIKSKQNNTFTTTTRNKLSEIFLL